ncbi:Deuterolysin metalloprotease family-domain-containing protein [Aspergillus crustosus]
MRFTASVALLALLQGISASPVAVKVAPKLQVTLSQVDNTRLKAVVKNAGSEDVTFVHTNFFKDASPVKKVSLFRDDDELTFEGVEYTIKITDIPESILTSLAPGATVEDEFDIATTSNLSDGGSITVRSTGFVPLVTNKRVTGSVPFTSNDLTIEIDGAKASKISRVGIKPRTTVDNCSGTQQTALETALRNTVTWASGAAEAAAAGSGPFETFFKTTSSSVRDDVAARFRAIASEASSTTSGATTYNCEDVYGYCSPGVIAYTLPAYDIIANCDIFYDDLPDVTSTCYNQDRVGTALHEMAHAPGVYSPGTEDLGYGYEAATALSQADALNNADSFALYANAIYLGC